MKKTLILSIFIATIVLFNPRVMAEQRNYYQLFESHGSVKLIIDVETGQILYANQAAEKYYGYPRERLLTMVIQDINQLTPEEVEQERKAVAEEKRNYFLFPHRLADGQIRHVEVYSYPFSEGGRQLLYSVINDVTDRILLEEHLATRSRLFYTVLLLLIAVLVCVIFQLKRSMRSRKETMHSLEKAKNNYQALFENMQEGFAVYRIIRNESGEPVDYRFMDVNKAYENSTNLKKEHLIGKSIHEVRPGMEEYCLEAYKEVATTGNAKSIEGYSGEMNKYFFVHYFRPVENTLALVLFDVTARKQLEAKVEEEKERLRVTLLSVGDGVITTDKEGRIELMNEAAQQMTGWSLEEASGKHLNEVFYIIDETTCKTIENPVEVALCSGRSIGLNNYTLLISKNGTESHISYSSASIAGANQDTQGAVLVFRDVTEQKRKIERIEYLSYHDSLTGLHNRRFFEEALRHLDAGACLPASIIIGDLNGLKLVNDAFGHFTGDNLLIKVAEIILTACRADDIVARWGGDEFVLLLPKTDKEDADKVIDRIKSLCADTEVESINLSISLGSATKVDMDTDIEKVLIAAETKMYKNKLHESQSMINQAIRVIHGTLLEKTQREAQHSKRVAALGKEIALSLGFSEAKANEMETIGLMHDIGKIVVSESILNKPDSLNEQEWNEIRRHPEVGYRILSISRDTADIAHFVLSHHERFDGTGYPQGIQGEEIPLQSRILAVADTFDAMTSERAYRKAMSAATAIEEIKKNSGTQFDPHIVQIFTEIVMRENVCS